MSASFSQLKFRVALLHVQKTYRSRRNDGMFRRTLIVSLLLYHREHSCVESKTTEQLVLTEILSSFSSSGSICSIEHEGSQHRG